MPGIGFPSGDVTVTFGKFVIEVEPADPWTGVTTLESAVPDPLFTLAAGLDALAFADATTGGAKCEAVPPRPPVPVIVVLVMPTGLNFVVNPPIPPANIIEACSSLGNRTRVTSASNRWNVPLGAS